MCTLVVSCSDMVKIWNDFSPNFEGSSELTSEEQFELFLRMKYNAHYSPELYAFIRKKYTLIFDTPEDKAWFILKQE